MEPCGCRKDMLGGVDHAAALIAKGAAEAPNAVVLGAGPLFFMNPELKQDQRTQDIWKAEALAASMAELGLSAWAPGFNDFAAGAKRLDALRSTSKAALLAGNIDAPGVNVQPIRVLEVGGYKVGIAGVALPERLGKTPANVQTRKMTQSLSDARAKLSEAGAQLLVALVAAPRGQALRLVEAVPGYHLMVLGKPFDEGEGNDAPISPTRIDKTLVVQLPNHLQALGVVDLFIRGDSFDFKDASGLEAAAKRASLQERARELETRIERWEEQGGLQPQDLRARHADLKQLRDELERLQPASPPKTGSFFRYGYLPVVEGAGETASVAKRMLDYYRRVNEHNRRAFKDRKPEPVEKGQSHYVGVEACASCHDEAVEFWGKTKHAEAYPTLEKQHKQFNLDCVACHVTGYDRPGGSTVTHVERLTNVQCEVCHGPGSRHADETEMESIVARPTADTCKQCHHEPHVDKSWSAKLAWKRIIGPGHGEPASK